LVMKPLARIAVLNPQVAAALATYQQASPDQQLSWIKSYSGALKKASDDNGKVILPAGDYGPVATLMNGMLDLARAGLLEGALDSSSLLPYDLNNTKSLLFLEGPIENRVAQHLNELGSQWGMTNEMGPYPGAWWLWPYAFLYQIPGIANSPNADLITGLIMAVAFLLLIFLPVIPGLNRIPYLIPVYRLIWRDWYRRSKG
ncbi:cytochrome b/b6 domain protein, partial [mine drainage metagenome]